MNYAQFAAFILLLPLLSFVVLGIWGRRYLSKLAPWFGTASMAAVCALSLYAAFRYFFVDGSVGGVFQPIIAMQVPWLEFGYKNLSIDLGLLLDPISVMMLVVISVVSLMVHLFSMGYMKGEDRVPTYYAFLSLFSFSMLGLVLSVNLFQIYIFWELVGASSFLLIGFFFTKPSAVAASKKAFIVTRFADLFFLIGILIMGIQAGSFDFGVLLQQLTNPASEASVAMASAGFLGLSALTWALVLIFIGGAGKSAMLPLHIWLPDAMEGPTPVSALIHAATMVVAGVYLVARLFPVFQLDALAMQVVTWVGASSALFAAVIACTQTDIKRVLAYSTMSQIGYMMFSLGVGGQGETAALGYTASMFHLFTHAFFKSLLFLGAGAVIHFVHSNDMRDMGGLRRLMPLTHISFLIGCLAIAGVPPFAGFFSKEEILLAAWQSNKLVYYLALFTAALTAFYMFRLYFMIFWQADKQYHHHSEGTLSMKLPLLLLALLSISAGFVPFSQFVSADGRATATHMHWQFSIAPVVLVILGIGLAAWLYRQQNDKPAKLAASLGSFYKGAYRKFYFDELYLFVTHRILFKMIGKPAAWADKQLVDGAVNASGDATLAAAQAIKGWQSGKVQQYLLVFLLAVLLLAAVLLFFWLV
ncbi:MAG: NADH-quinone oxidoreductase subunit L [Chitinophagaceae bacterium]|nr:NADH-quinone oxidoreductase subunit L [Chitinophagaceae bacterium]